MAAGIVTSHKALHGLAQMGNAALINAHDLGQSRARVSKSFGCNEGR